MFIATGKLKVEAAHQRYVHFFRYDRHGKFEISCGNITLAKGVGIIAHRRCVARRDFTRDRIDKRTRSIKRCVTVVALRLAAELRAESNADIASG